MSLAILHGDCPSGHRVAQAFPIPLRLDDCTLTCPMCKAPTPIEGIADIDIRYGKKEATSV